jgi:hypothetical protein
MAMVADRERRVFANIDDCVPDSYPSRQKYGKTRVNA